jgi:hypothetical protein
MAQALNVKSELKTRLLLAARAIGDRFDLEVEVWPYSTGKNDWQLVVVGPNGDLQPADNLAAMEMFAEGFLAALKGAKEL